MSTVDGSNPGTPASEARSLSDRLTSLLDHLGLTAAHFATQMPGDLADLCARHPARVAGVVLAVPVRLDALPFAGVADRLLIVTGETGIGRPMADAAGAALPGARCHVLAGYDAPGWADLAADRPDEVASLLSRFLGAGAAAQGSEAPRFPTAERRGAHAGLTWRAEGTGPALVLLPFFLAATQWDPVVPALARQFTVIRVGGAHVGGVAALEDRARLPSYQGMFRTMLGLMAPRPGERLLDIGCGSGALDRLAARLHPDCRIVASDVNAFLLGEAEALAAAEGLTGRIAFAHGSATALPFPDSSFDGAWSITVFEECDAERAISEVMRVVRPGGRIGLAVRAIDMPQWWSFPVPAGLEAIANTPPQSVARGGVADARLYAMMQAAGIGDLEPFPALVTLDRPGTSIWRYREDAVLAAFTPRQRQAWEAAREAARADGRLWQASALHCAVGRRRA